MLGYRAPGKRKVGRPCFTWNNCLLQDIAKSHIPLEAWKEVSHNRALVKQMTTGLYATFDHSDDGSSDHETDWDSDQHLLGSDFDGFSDDDGLFRGFDS